MRLSKLILPALFVLAAACSGAERETPSATVGAYDPSFLDQSAEPCTDFYQYACGTWIQQHQAAPGYVVQRFQNGDYREDIYFSQLIEAMASSDPTLDDARRYYAGCLGAEHNVATGVPSALTAELESVNAMTSMADLAFTLATLARSGVWAILSGYPQIDPGNPTAYVISIADAGWSLPSVTSYDDATLTAAYQAHLNALASAAKGASVQFSPSAAAGVVSLERAIATAASPTSDPSASLDPSAAYNPLTSEQLVAAVPGFDWATYFRVLGFGSVARVTAISSNFPSGLASILASTPLATVQQYLRWRILETDGSSATKAMYDEEFHFHRTVLEGQARDPADDEYWCLLATRGWFGFELAQHYVEHFVGSEVKPSAIGLVEAVRSAMRDNFSQVSWLDDETRAAAQQKLDLLLPKVAYPDTWPAPRAAFSVGDSYLDMAIRMIQQSENTAAAGLAQPVDRTEFWASPEITNAFYSPSRNDITIPVAVLQDPFFNPARPLPFSYGALGAVIGHELTHAFDSSGRHFDGTGMLTDWWTAASAKEFQTRAQCLVDQYNGYEALPGVQVNGGATLNENIADLGGLKLAHAAFQAAMPPKSTGQFTAEQQFFLSYAQLFCTSSSSEAAQQLAATDPHSPAKFRVNGVLRNLPQFADAFSCPAGASLAPTGRCEIW